jgi:hypothetical protein
MAKIANLTISKPSHRKNSKYIQKLGLFSQGTEKVEKELDIEYILK